METQNTEYISKVDVVMWLSSGQWDLSERAGHSFWKIP